MINPEEVLQHALTFYRAGSLAEAEELCLAILQSTPTHAAANYCLGLMALQQEQAEKALPYLRTAWEQSPEEGAYWLTLTECLLALARFEDALGLIEEAIQRGLDTPETQQLKLRAQRWADRDAPNAAVTEEAVRLFNAGCYEELERSMLPLLEQYPGWDFGWKALGVAMGVLGKNAELPLSRSVALSPHDFEAHKNLGVFMAGAGRHSEALSSYRRALEIKPDDAVVHSNLLFCLIHDSALVAQDVFSEHCCFGDKFEMPLRKEWGGYANTPEPNRCLRVGIVSADLLNHAVAHFIEPILSWLAVHSSVVLCAYSNVVNEDSITQRMKGLFAHWRMVAGLTDEGLAQQIRADGIDILIDLSGHTRNNRLLTFARKPAPIQVSWMGYPGTTGLQAMDYYLGDRFFLPPGKFDQQFTEKIVRLPANAPFLPAPESPPVNALPALTNRYITFGSFNRLNKITKPVIALWSRLLNAVPGSKMLMGAMPEGDDHSRLIAWFAGEGVGRDRLIFYPRTGIAAYLELHHQVDICLDTFPYNGGTTTCHAVWMGVPTLTLAGEAVTGRVGAAVLSHVGLDEFIAQDAEDFVRKGLRWAGDIASLSELRNGMRERFAQSALGRPEVIAAALVQALRIMWRRWCAGLPPESFEVDAASNADEILQHAATFYQAGRLAEAEELCMSILQSEPTHADANYNLGLMALQQGGAERALPYLQAAWEVNPSEGQYWLTLTECLLELARFEDALALANEAIRRGMDTPEVQQLRLLARRGVSNATGGAH